MPSRPPSGPAAANSLPPSSTSGWAGPSSLLPDPLAADSPLPDAATTSLLRQLQRQQGPQSRRALVLALVQTPGSAREAQAWREETQALQGAAGLPEQLQALPGNARLPLLEWALQQCAADPATDRAELLRGARRVMSADGKVRPADRLRWLLMRHLLSGQHRPQPVPMPRARAELALADLPESKRVAIARFSAYLARLVPVTDPIAKVGTAGVAWYRAVMRHCWFNGAPACQVPDADELAHALADLQQLSWMQRPVLVRTWSQAAVKVTQRLWRHEPLTLEAAEALRVAAVLLDTPVSGAVAARFPELPASPGVEH